MLKEVPEIARKLNMEANKHHRAPIMITPCEMIQLPNKKWINGFPRKGMLKTVTERSGRVFLFFSPRFRVSGEIMEWDGKGLKTLKNPMPKNGCIRTDAKSKRGFRVDAPCSDSFFAGHVVFVNDTWKYIARSHRPSSKPTSRRTQVKKKGNPTTHPVPAAPAKKKPAKAGERCWKRNCFKWHTCLVTPKGPRCFDKKLLSFVRKSFNLKTTKNWCSTAHKYMESALLVIAREALEGRLKNRKASRALINKWLSFSNQIGCQKPYPYNR